MDTPDWIELWLLNQLVCMPCRLAQLVSETSEPSWNYWDFPDDEALNADPNIRSNRLLECVDKGLIRIYPSARLDKRQFGLFEPLLVKECALHNLAFVNEHEAVLTLPGHQKWESEFEPDWGRFWKVEGESIGERSDERLFHVLYASDQILEDLLKWFPAFRELDEQVGLKELGCHTSFQYQVTQWKLIEFVKVIRWQGLSNLVETNRLLHIPLPSSESVGFHETKQAAIAKFHLHLKQQSERREEASHILNRLSKRWTVLCTDRGTRQSRELKGIV
jgi:hypothetical protein